VQTAAALLTRLLRGEGQFQTVGPGTSLPGPDLVSNAIVDRDKPNQGGGLPLKYRWITRDVTGAGELLTVMRDILSEVRDANLSHIPDEVRAEIRKSWDTEPDRR
jgi:hypothetical protein